MKIKIFIYSFILFLFSCEKDNLDELSTKKEINVHQKSLVSAKGPVVYSSTFDWENINEINTAIGVKVPMPWYGSTFLSSEMKHTHPKSEGWEMLYNTLDHNDVAPTFFALYNKYLGVMHLFYYDVIGLESAELFNDAYRINGSTALFNYEVSDNKGVEQKDYSPIIVKGPEGSFSSGSNNAINYIPDNGFATRTLYVTEIEFCYEDLTGLSDSAFYLQYLPFRGKFSTITLDGSLTGTIKGTIEAKSSGSTNLLGSISNIFNRTSNKTNVNVNKSNIVGTVIDNVKKAQTEATPTFWNGLWKKISDKIPGVAQDNIVNGLTSVVNAGMKWASNPLSGFVSSLFSIGGSSQNVPLNKVDLKIDATINLDGTIESRVPNHSCDLRFPQTTPTMGGYGYPTLEMKDWNLGVWNVENLPGVNYDITNVNYRINGRAVRDPQDGGVDITIPNYSLIKINVNPRVLDDCNIIESKVQYIIETNDRESMADLDNLRLSPFNFRPSNKGVNTQGYIFPNDYVVGFHRSYHIFGTCGSSVYARATLVLKHKLTGQEYIHIKDFPLKPILTVSNIWVNIDEPIGPIVRD